MKNDKVTRRRFLGTGAVLAGFAAAGCATNPEKKASGQSSDLPYVSRLRVRRPGAIRILQITDIHLFAGEEPFWKVSNEKSLADIQGLVKSVKPDLLFITGDLWRDYPDEKVDEFAAYAIARCGEFGVPWAYVWGNHDKVMDRAAVDALLTNTPNSLYRGAATDGNYVLNLEDRHGRVVWQFLCIDSKGTGIVAPQQAWIKSLPDDLAGGKAGVTPRMAAFHIPLRQYATMWADGSARGIKCETVCSEQEDGSSLALLKKAGVKACFCGHDHVCDYSAVVDGVDLIYGRSTGRGGYGGMQVRKGGKLYTLDGRTGKYRWESVLFDGTRWVPGPDERVDKTPADKK